MKGFVLGALTLAMAGAATPAAAAGTLVVSGDTTIVSRLVSGIADPSRTEFAGNITFARALLGGGDTASIYTYSVVTSTPNPPLGTQLATAYNGFAGVSASTFDNGITPSVLQGADLLVVLGREFAYTTQEVDLVRGFLQGGGNVLLTGDSANIAFGANAITNTLLAGIGSSIRLGQVTQGIGDQFATGSEILANPLTAGITSFGYGRTTTVSGGTTLFLNDDGNAFIATETFATAAVPEPASWAMLMVGFGAVGGAMRRRTRVTFAQA